MLAIDGGSAESAGPVHDDGDPNKANAGSQDFKGVWRPSVNQPSPQHGHDDEDAAIGGVHPTERGGLKGRDQAVGDKNHRAQREGGYRPVGPHPLSHEVAPADLGQPGQDEEGNRPENRCIERHVLTIGPNYRSGKKAVD